MIDASYRRQNLDPGNRRFDPERAHGMAYGALPAPTVNNKLGVVVYVNGVAMPSTFRVTDGSSGHDGRAVFAGPDVRE
jgi:hypothetical protein